MDIQAYFEEWSRLPGERVRMAISTDHPRVRASLERITKGPAGADLKAEDAFGHRVPGLDTIVDGIRQDTALGSYSELPMPEQVRLADSTLHLWIWPTTPASDDVQTIWAGGDGQHWLSLGIQRRDLALRINGQVWQFGTVLEPHTWYSIALTLVAREDGIEAALDLCQVSGLPARPPRFQGRVHLAAALPELTMLRLAADEVSAAGSPVSPYNGKIENPSFFAPALTAEQCATLHADASPRPADVRWDLSKNLEGTRVVAEGAPDGELRNGGDRGVTGRNWTGRCDSFLEAPDQYGAVHFHDDDMVDANWE